MELQLFTTQDGRPLDWQIFLQSPLGKLYLAIPFQRYLDILPYEEPLTGPRPWFDLKGGIALQILKHRYKVSDEKLIELLNDSKSMQYFCGINLQYGTAIKDDGVVSRWRARLGHYLNIPRLLSGLQLSNVAHWKDKMEEPKTNLSDATCYESYVRFPTDVKLLWECIDYLYGQMKVICKYIVISMPRSKYKEQYKKYLSYQKSRRKSYKKTRQVRRRLLYLLNKYLKLLPPLIGGMKSKEANSLCKCKVKHNFFARLSIIKKVYQQQQLHFDYPKTKIKNRIISLAKPYLRPIVRGKETKRVEFGMKVHEMQVDGINFIEYWDFEAFHEGVRMKQTLWKHQSLFRKKCKLFGGDQIYANNKNRRYLTSQNVESCFKAKGKLPADSTIRKQKSQLRQLIGKARATKLEGSFGNKKNHYLLDKIKARNYFTELAWIFFGNLTANVTAIAKRDKSPPVDMAT